MTSGLAERYRALLEDGAAQVAAGLDAAPGADLLELETRPGWRHFPSALLVAAVLERHDLVRRIASVLLASQAAGTYTPRLDSHRDTYLWLEAYRQVGAALESEERAAWEAALRANLAFLREKVAERADCPQYCSPFLVTSPNHLSLWAATLFLGGLTFGEADWEALGRRVLRRFVTEEQAPDGYWGEHSPAGPTTGYDYLTVTAIALYYEHSADPDALAALRRSTEFHLHYTWPDGQPVETINDRNRVWEVSMWGHFGFSHFPDGRRYAAFLTGKRPGETLDLESLGRIAQNAVYFHEGDEAPIPQELHKYVHRMQIPAGIRKSGPWAVCLSGLIATQALHNQFYLDRQGHLSVFHERVGLILTGAGSKHQPELATFWEKLDGVDVTIAQGSRLRMDEAGDSLALAYNTFYAELIVAPPTQQRLELSIATSFKYGQAESRLTLQLVLDHEAPIETGAGWIRHRGWTLFYPEEARLDWPVHPFNPYTGKPGTDRTRAVGALWIPLKTENQTFRFTIEVDG